MRILGIETVTKIGSLAVLEDGQVLAEVTIDTNLRHAANLIQALAGMLNGVRLGIADIDALAVDTGPGSFTGIRVGMASAQGLVTPGEKPLWGICSLEVLCLQILASGVPAGVEYLVPFIDAKRGEVYNSWYRVNDQEVTMEKAPYTAALSDFIKELPDKCYLFGPDLTKFKNSLPAGKTAAADLYPRAAGVASLAEKKIKRGIPQKSFMPVYMCDKIVTRSKK